MAELHLALLIGVEDCSPRVLIIVNSEGTSVDNLYLLGGAILSIHH